MSTSHHEIGNLSPGDTIRFILRNDQEVTLQVTTSSIDSEYGKLLLSAKPIGIIGTIELRFKDGQLFQIGNLWFRWKKNGEISILGAHFNGIERRDTY